MNDAPLEPAPTRAQPYAIAGRTRLPGVLARLYFGRAVAPTPEEWARVVAGLDQGDPPMDRVVAWMFEIGPTAARLRFEQALTHGIETIDDPPAPLADFFATVDRAPAWLDRDLLAHGATVMQATGLVSFYVLRDIALMGGYARYNSANQVLAATGALRKDVGRRLGETGAWLGDVTKPGGLDRFGDGFASTIRVRMVHALVRRAFGRRGDWDAATWGAPINQIDLAATYLGFGPAMVIGARLFGVPIGPRGSRAAMHLWRYVGWLSGVDEPWLATTEREGMRTLHHARLTHRLPDEKVGLLGAALRDEALSRRLPGLDRFPRLERLARRYLYHKHLSNSALVLDRSERRRLGLPRWTLPWYPLLTAPVRFAVHAAYRLHGRRGLDALAARGRAAQQRLLASYFPDRAPGLIQPAADHPAHVA
jgi:hypothetical protein